MCRITVLRSLRLTTRMASNALSFYCSAALAVHALLLTSCDVLVDHSGQQRYIVDGVAWSLQASAVPRTCMITAALAVDAEQIRTSSRVPSMWTPEVKHSIVQVETALHHLYHISAGIACYLSSYASSNYFRILYLTS